MALDKQLLVNYLSTLPEISAVYLFGSQVDGSTHSNSDVDLAILFKRGLSAEFYADQQLFLGGKLCQILKRDDVDLVVLNRASSSELKYSIVHDGEVLFEREPNLAEYELRVEHEYYDHLAALKRNGF